MANKDQINRWIVLALSPSVVERSTRVALVVGSILIFINYIDKIIAINLTAFDILKMIVMYFVSYCVATYASVEAIIRKDVL